MRIVTHVYSTRQATLDDFWSVRQEWWPEWIFSGFFKASSSLFANIQMEILALAFLSLRIPADYVDLVSDMVQNRDTSMNSIGLNLEVGSDGEHFLVLIS